ncbi:MAG: radical SAM protein [Methanoregulaceae archaeon]|jgi:biotin synthase-related radical SAM superfamily protein|nr:radical SAM protein [Methanoregulaceae archaeon]
MDWLNLKARLLAEGSIRLSGVEAPPYISSSAAGPGAGGSGSVFFSNGEGRVRLSLDPGSRIELVHLGAGKAVLYMEGQEIEGYLEPVALHCPRQAYLTLSGGCVYRCRYCEVPAINSARKTPEQIEAMVESVADRIDAISLTSGVLYDLQEEEDYVLEVVRRLKKFEIPLGVSIFPGINTAEKLSAGGVAEVKFNIEAATVKIFAGMCPDLDRDLVWKALQTAVPLFGRGHVFSNLIIGLGETDEEAEQCIRALCERGVIPVLRPLNPAGELKTWKRPSAKRLLRLFTIHGQALKDSGLDPGSAVSMCVSCTGCDLGPGRDAPL